MASATYDPIASTTLTSSASSVTFSSLDTIAAGYRDLVLVVDSNTSGNSIVATYFNGDTTATNYNFVRMRGDGSTASSSTSNNANTSIFYSPKTITIFQFMDFSATDKHKSYLIRNNAAEYATHAYAARWSNTAAITSINLTGSVNFDSGSVFSLYGIVA